MHLGEFPNKKTTYPNMHTAQYSARWTLNKILYCIILYCNLPIMMMYSTYVHIHVLYCILSIVAEGWTPPVFWHLIKFSQLGILICIPFTWNRASSSIPLFPGNLELTNFKFVLSTKIKVFLGEMDWTLTIDRIWFLHFCDQLFNCSKANLT